MAEWKAWMRATLSSCVSSGVAHSEPLARTCRTSKLATAQCSASGSGPVTPASSTATRRLPHTTRSRSDSKPRGPGRAATSSARWMPAHAAARGRAGTRRA